MKTTKARAMTVLTEHAECGSAAEVHPDETGTIRYSCGIVVTDVHSLADADRRHQVAALAAADCLADDREDVTAMRFDYTVQCPRCGERKFIGHGPLCTDCLHASVTPQGGSQP